MSNNVFIVLVCRIQGQKRLKHAKLNLAQDFCWLIYI